MKKQLIVLSAAAMVVAAAVPALAFENEFHGMYRLRGMATNFQAYGLGATAAGTVLTTTNTTGTPLATTAVAPAKNPPLFSENDRTYTLFEQRARIQYIAKASDDLKLVTFFEIDSSWGDNAYTNGRGGGAGAGADSVNLETKNVYLDFNIPSTPVQMKVGLQPWSDAYKGIIYNNDLAGALAIGKFDALTVSGAFFRTYDSDNGSSVNPVTTLGKKNVDLYVLDGKFALNKDTTLGASYYRFYNDNTTNGTPTATVGTENAATDTFGINAATKLGIVGLSGFVLYQTGDAIYDFQSTTGKTKDLSAWAAEIAATANLGIATVRGGFLYTSGDDKSDGSESTAFQVVQENSAGAVTGANYPATFTGQGGNYYSSNMLLLFRNVYNMDSDNAMIANLNNGNHGVMAAYLGTDVKVNDKFSISANAGAGWNDKKQYTAAGKEEDAYLGTEVNLNLNYKLYPNLTTTLQGAYVVLGKYYDNSDKHIDAAGADPKDPFLAGVMLNYTF